MRKCKRCGATGHVDVKYEKCPNCHGKGGIDITEDEFDGEQLKEFYRYLIEIQAPMEYEMAWYYVNMFRRERIVTLTQ